jgi:pilus assembly protein Flp/PilA
MRIIKLLTQLGRDEEATTAVEYAVMLAMILMAVIAGIGSFGTAQNSMWGRIDTQMQAHGIK